MVKLWAKHRKIEILFSYETFFRQFDLNGAIKMLTKLLNSMKNFGIRQKISGAL